MSSRVEVAAAVLTRADGRFLLGRRAAGSFYPGYWEFPGGKLEAGEDARSALVRELREELGIEARTLYPWIVREFHYEHAHVRLHFFEVPSWDGELTDHIHDALAWQNPGAVDVSPMLPANAPVLKALELPRVMAVSAGSSAAPADPTTALARLDQALQQGVRLIQLRDPGHGSTEREPFARAALARCNAAQALLLINDDARLAERIGADGLHLPARRLVETQQRPDFAWVGASCHTRAELEHAATLGLDYAVLGPVRETPTHPGAPALGWESFTALAAQLPLPVFAIGGLGLDDLEQARTAGAHGVAGIRGMGLGGPSISAA